MRSVTRFAWGLLAYDLATIAWGTYVRATGSGAGCGRHWPLCNGQVIPIAKSVATRIEATHRLTSGLSVVLTVALVVLALRSFPKGHPVRWTCGVAAGLIGTEALIGAALVHFELVARDQSAARAVVIGAHLVNTFLLLAATSLSAWWASHDAPARLRGQAGVLWILGPPLLAILAVGATGAVTALGDTLFPASSLAAGFAQDLSTSAPGFVRLRTLHPLLAVATAGAVIVAGSAARLVKPTREVRALSRAAAALAVLQVAAGLLDVGLLAPVPLQIVHLLLADAVWISLVLTTAAALAARPPSAVA